MSTYTDAMNKLSDALMLVEPDGPEWVKIEATIAELTRAEAAEAKKAFVEASRGLHDAVAKLEAVARLNSDSASQMFSLVKGAITDLLPIEKNIKALLSGEPASALPGMEMANTVEASLAGDDPAVAAPNRAPRPVRERGRTEEELKATPPQQVSPEQMIDAILGREGEFVDHPTDRGGPTKFGVTLKTLASWLDKQVDANDVRALRREVAKEIFRSRYYVEPKINQLPCLIQPLVFDMSINHGPGTAVRLLQEVLDSNGYSCSIDGGIGEETLECAQAAESDLGNKLVNELVDRRIDLYEDIVRQDPSQAVFLEGWLQRARKFNV